MGLRSLGLSLHHALAQHPRIASLYLRSVGLVTRALPDSGLVRRVVNNVRSVAWPSLAFRPRWILLGARTQVRLTPHPGEFDFEAQFRPSLSYEPEVFRLLDERIHRYDAAIDIGANVGLFTLYFAQHVRRVIACEPSPAVFQRLQANLANNGAQNVTAFPVAVAETSGIADLYEPDGHLTNASLERGFLAGLAVATTRVETIDGHALAALVPATDRLIIKIDVEGAEPRVLCGLMPLLDRQPADLIIEVLASTVDALNAMPEIRRRFDLFGITPTGLVPRERFMADETRDYWLQSRTPSA